MEAMEVDSPSGVQAAAAEAPDVTSDSGSSTEVEEDEEDGGQTSAGAPPRLPSTWAFSQRALSSSASSSPATPPIRRRVRYQEADDGAACGWCWTFRMSCMLSQTGSEGSLPQPDRSAL